MTPRLSPALPSSRAELPHCHHSSHLPHPRPHHRHYCHHLGRLNLHRRLPVHWKESSQTTAIQRSSCGVPCEVPERDRTDSAIHRYRELPLLLPRTVQGKTGSVTPENTRRDHNYICTQATSRGVVGRAQGAGRRAGCHLSFRFV